MWQAALTELVATACLLFTLTTTVIACSELQVAEPKLLIPFAVFIAVFLLLLVTIPVSGGHINPIFTCIFALKGVITFVRAVFYILAQCLGSIIAYFIIKNIMNNSIIQKHFLGGCIVGENGAGISAGTALIIEFSCTFLLLYIAVTVAFDKGRCKELGLTMVCIIVAVAFALGIFISITVTGQSGYGGVGLHPARCLGPAVFLGGPLWNGHWVFWVGPFLACIVYYTYSLTLPRNGFVRVDEERHILELVLASCWGTGSPTSLQDKI